RYFMVCRSCRASLAIFTNRIAQYELSGYALPCRILKPSFCNRRNPTKPAWIGLTKHWINSPLGAHIVRSKFAMPLGSDIGFARPFQTAPPWVVKHPQRETNV